MHPVAAHLARVGNVARRRDLLAAGFTDAHLRSALGSHAVFRVRQGWYALPAMSDIAVRAIRVGGRLTGVAALRARGLFLPAQTRVDVAVPRTASRLRRPGQRRQRLLPGDGIRVNWVDPPRGGRAPSDWIATDEEALLCVLRRESRMVAIACCDGLLRYRGWTGERLDEVFARAPERVQAWRCMVDGRSDSWGETDVRLRLRDAGIPLEPQPELPGIGRLDGRVSPNVYVEIDGAQHDENWSGESPSSFEHDHTRDLGVAVWGGRVIRITYAQLDSDWPLCLAAIEAAIAADVGPPGRGTARQRKRRRN